MENSIQDTFILLREMLHEYAPPFIIKIDNDTSFELYSPRRIILGGKTINGIFFCGITLQKESIGLYFMPVYINPKLILKLNPNFARLLQGKSCFYIKNLNTLLIEAVKETVEIGLQEYKRYHWI